MVFPVAVGTGKRLFDGAPKTKLRVVDSTPVGPDGIVVITYEPVQ